MFKFCILSVFIITCNAAGGGYGRSGGYGGSVGGGGGGYGGGVIGGGGGYGGGGVIGGGFGGGPITAAVQSQHTVEIRHVNLPQEVMQPQIVEVDAGQLPLTIHFKSASSNINVVQTHQPSDAGEIKQTSSEDEPHRLVHEVTKPIIQEVREIITPFRRVIQEIRPVQEEIQTIVARGEPRSRGFADGGFGGGAIGGAAIGGGGAVSRVSVSGGGAGYSGGGLSSGGYSSGGHSSGGYSGASSGVANAIKILEGGSGSASYGAGGAVYRSKAARA